MQSKRASFAESITNIFTGLPISWLLTFALLPLLDGLTLETKATILTVVFTVASIIRSYLLRRLFNHLNTRFR